MSDRNTEAQNAPDETQLTDEEVESVSGGVIDGGCIKPFGPPPTLPQIDGYLG